MFLAFTQLWSTKTHCKDLFIVQLCCGGQTFVLTVELWIKLLQAQHANSNQMRHIMVYALVHVLSRNFGNIAANIIWAGKLGSTSGSSRHLGPKNYSATPPIAVLPSSVLFIPSPFQKGSKLNLYPLMKFLSEALGHILNKQKIKLFSKTAITPFGC